LVDPVVAKGSMHDGTTGDTPISLTAVSPFPRLIFIPRFIKFLCLVLIFFHSFHLIIRNLRLIQLSIVLSTEGASLNW